MLLSVYALTAKVNAQVGAIESDYLEVTLTDQNGTAVLPALHLPIPEPADPTDPGEPPMTFIIPSVTVDFMEAVGPALTISDRFHVNDIDITVLSANLMPRANATRIPGQALERFLPVQIVAFSDGESAAGTNSPSDVVRIRTGIWDPTLGPGTLVFDQALTEPTAEQLDEPALNFAVQPILFDVAEPPAEGPTGQVVSDYVNMGPVTGFFISSDDPTHYAGLPPANATLTEDVLKGGSLTYTIRFVSDAVPEPASFGLCSVAVCGLGAIARRRPGG